MATFTVYRELGIGGMGSDLRFIESFEATSQKEANALALLKAELQGGNGGQHIIVVQSTLIKCLDSKWKHDNRTQARTSLHEGAGLVG